MARKYQTPKRPIDKDITYVSSASLGTTQDNSVLRTSTVAETYTGGHINASVVPVSAGGIIQMVLAVVPEGITSPTLTTTDANALYTPEEYVVWSQTFALISGQVTPIQVNAKIKSMRKMKVGDRLILSARGSVATVGTTHVLVTAFYKQ